MISNQSYPPLIFNLLLKLSKFLVIAIEWESKFHKLCTIKKYFSLSWISTIHLIWSGCLDWGDLPPSLFHVHSSWSCLLSEKWWPLQIEVYCSFTFKREQGQDWIICWKGGWKSFIYFLTLVFVFVFLFLHFLFLFISFALSFVFLKKVLNN